MHIIFHKIKYCFNFIKKIQYILNQQFCCVWNSSELFITKINTDRGRRWKFRTSGDGWVDVFIPRCKVRSHQLTMIVHLIINFYISFQKWGWEIICLRPIHKFNYGKNIKRFTLYYWEIHRQIETGKRKNFGVWRKKLVEKCLQHSK